MLMAALSCLVGGILQQMKQQHKYDTFLLDIPQFVILGLAEIFTVIPGKYITDLQCIHL